MKGKRKRQKLLIPGGIKCHEKNNEAPYSNSSVQEDKLGCQREMLECHQPSLDEPGVFSSHQWTQQGHPATRIVEKRPNWKLPTDYGIIYKRLQRNVYMEVNTPESNVTPSYLRPCWTHENSRIEAYSLAPSDNTPICGNRLVNFGQLTKLLNTITSWHGKENPDCPGDFFFPSDKEVTHGLCTSVIVTCKLCNTSSSRIKLFEEVITNRRGRRAGKMNIQLSNVLSKSSVSLKDMRLIFAGIDANAISESSLQKSINKNSVYWEAINEKQMAENRAQLKQIVLCRDGKEAEMTKIGVEIDTSYASAPKGRAMYQPGHQSITPLLENETKNKMLIGLISKSQHCSCNPGTNPEHKGCTANLPQLVPMCRSEVCSAEEHYKRCMDDGLIISEVTHDGIDNSSHMKGMRNAANMFQQQPPESYMCTIHLSRGLKRKAFNITISQRMVGTTNADDRRRFITQLGMAVDQRCTAELFLAKKKFSGNNIKYTLFMEVCRKNIIDCLSGSHTGCNKYSLACTRSPKSLPSHQYLQMDQKDRSEVQKLIDYKLSAEKVWAQRKLRNTNAVEAFHLRMLKVTPKTKTCRRNYSARNHSAAHNASVGIGNSLIEINEGTSSALTKGGPAIKVFQQIEDRSKYFRARQASTNFRIQRRNLRLRKLKLKKLQTLSLQEGPLPGEISNEHSYCNT
jgi:hypothetical protein